MSIFKKKNNNNNAAAENQQTDMKQLILTALNEKLQGTIYDNCVIMPKGFTIDVQVGQCNVKNNVYMLQSVYIVRNDEFDEPIIEPVESQGKTEEEAAKMSAEIFFGGLWHPINQSIRKQNPTHISVNYLKQHYDFDMYAQSIVRIGGKEKQPVMLINFIKSEIPKYLGSKKYYWVRIYLAQMNNRRIAEIRVNGTVCFGLTKFFKDYVSSWPSDIPFASEKQYAIFVQREDDKCPFTKQTVVETARKTIPLMENCKSPEEYKQLITKVEEFAGDPALAAEVRIFIPEILARLTMGYNEGDSLFLMEDDSRIEFRKTQLRSYFYIQQVLLDYLRSKPDKEKVTRIIANSAAFRELKKAHDDGHEPKEIYIPGTSYKIAEENYKVW